MRAAREEKRGFLKGRRTSWLEMVPIIGTKNDSNTLFINDILNFTLRHAPKNAPYTSL